jgi:hypothetical protein
MNEPPYWIENLPRLEEACRRGGDLYGTADVLHMITTDPDAFWCATPNSFGVAELIAYPRKRVIHWSFAGGERAEILTFGEHYERLARLAGCTEIQMYGRPGWERVLTGYHKTGVVLRKRLEG